MLSMSSFLDRRLGKRPQHSREEDESLNVIWSNCLTRGEERLRELFYFVFLFCFAFDLLSSGHCLAEVYSVKELD